MAFFAKRTNTSFLAVALGFSAGVMLYVSFVEIFQKARDALATPTTAVLANWYTVGAFFSGVLFIALIDKLLPSSANPHQTPPLEEMGRGQVDGNRENRTINNQEEGR